MYIEYPYYYDGKHYANVDGEMIEITKEVAYAMKNAYRNAHPKKIVVTDSEGNEIDTYLREVPYSQSINDDVNSYNIGTMADSSYNIEDLILSQEKLDYVNDVIEKLSDIEKVIVRGVFFEEMTHGQVAAIVGLSRQAVDARMRTILKKIKKIMEKNIKFFA